MYCGLGAGPMLAAAAAWDELAAELHSAADAHRFPAIAGLGQATRVGGRSVPRMPASATAATIPAPQALAGNSVDALPAVNPVAQQPGVGSGLGSLVGGIPGSSKSTQQASSTVVRDLLRINVLPQPQYVG
ncbi:hypothetical protein A4G29_05635 [Mycobacterium kansasii]|nr:hypothetical protein A4G29_05635 [Mycobacterium kansasii]